MDSNYGVILCFCHHISVVYKKHIFFLKSEKIIKNKSSTEVIQI